MRVSLKKPEGLFSCDELPMPVIIYRKDTGQIMQLNKPARALLRVPMKSKPVSVWKFRSKKSIPLLPAKSKKMARFKEILHTTLTGDVIHLDVKTKSMKWQGLDCQAEFLDVCATPSFQNTDTVGVTNATVTAGNLAERKKVEREKEELVDQFRKISAHVPGMIYQYRLRSDGTSHFPYASNGIFDIYGLHPEEVVEDAAKVFTVIHPDDLQRVTETIQQSAATLAVWSDEYRVNLPSGKTIWVEGHSSPQRNADGSISWYGYITDVTSKREALQHVKESEERFKILYNQAPAMMHSIDRSGKIIRVSDYWLQKMGYTREEVIGRESTDFLSAESKKLAKEKYLPEFFSTGKVLDAEYQYITKSGEILETIVSATSERHQGELISMAVITDITEKKKLEREISKLALIASKTSNAVIFTDADGYITWVNEGFQKLTEYSYEEVVGRKPGDFLQGADTSLAAVNILRQGIANAEQVRCEILNYSKSGREYWLDIEIIPIKEASGQLTGFMSIESDITQLKNLVNEMLNSESRLKTMMDNAPMSVFMKDLKGHYIFFNQTLEKSLGSSGFKMGYHDNDLLDAALAEQTHAREKRVIESNESVTYEAEFGNRQYLATKFPILDREGKIYAIGGIALDVTERNLLAKQVKDKDERLVNIAKNIPGGVIYQYRADSTGNILNFPFVSDSCEEIYGISAATAQQDPMVMFNMVNPADVGKMMQLAEESRSKLTPFDVETRIVNARGEHKWMHTRSIPKPQKDGTMLWDGISLDITERKKLQSEVEENEYRLRTISQNIPKGAIYQFKLGADGSYSFPFITSGINSMLGLKLEEITADDSTLLQLAHPDDVDLFRSAVQVSAAELSEFHGTFRFKGADGNYRWLTAHAKPKRLADASTIWDGVLLDETDQKKTEEALRVSQRRLQAIFDNAINAIILADDQGNYVDANPAACRMLNYTYEQLTQFNVRDIAIMDSMKPDPFSKFLQAGGEAGTIFLRANGNKIIKVRYNAVANILPGIHLSVLDDITEKIKAEEDLRESEERWEFAVEGSNDGVWDIDLANNTLVLTKRCKEILGYTDEEIGTDLNTWINLVHSDDLAIAMKSRSAEPEGKGITFSNEHRRLCKDGTWKWIHVRGMVAKFDKNGNASRLIGTFSDITARKNAEQEIIKTSRLYELTSKINQLVVRTKSENEIYLEACKIAVEIGKFRMVWVGIVDPIANEIKPIVTDGYVDDYFKQIVSISTLDIPSGRGPSGTAAREKRTVVNNDITDASNTTYSIWREQALKRGYHSSIALPVTVKGEVVSIFTLYHSEPYFFNDKEVELLEELTSNIAFGLTSIRNERLRFEKEAELRDSEELFRTLVNDIKIGILLQGPNAEMLLSNGAALELLGISEAQLLGITSFDPRWNVIHEDGSDFPAETHPVPIAIKTRKSVRNVTMGVYHPERDARAWLSVDAVPRVDQLGNIKDVICTFHDVTEKKKAEVLLRQQAQEIRTKNEQFTSIAQNLPNGSIYQFLLKPDGTISMPFFSDGLANRLGITGQQVMDDILAFNSRCHPDDVEAVQNAVMTSARSLSDFRERVGRFRDNNGNYHNLGWYARPSRLDDGSILWQGVVMDETEQRQAERSLKLTRFTIDHASDPIFWIRPNASIADMNPAAHDSLGYTFKELIEKTIPDIDPHYTEEVWPNHWKELREKGVLHFQSQQRRKDGVLVDVEIDANYIVFEGQEFNCAFVRNVTEKKRMEMLLAEKEQQVRKLANNIPNGAIYQYQKTPGSAYRYNFFSQGIEGLTGLKPEEILRNPDSILDLIHPEDIGRLLQMEEISEKLLTPFSVEFRQGTLWGDYKWMQASSNPHKKTDGAVVWDGVIVDITDKKKSEQALVESNKEKDLLIKEIHHRVKNNLQLISSMVFVKLSSLQKGDFRDFLEDIRQKIRSIALIHERLLQTGSVNKVNIEDYLGKLITDLRMTSHGAGINIHIYYSIDSIEMNLDQAIYCGLIVNELVTNAIKHAFVGRNEGEIKITVRQTESHVELQVKDNGISIPQAAVEQQGETLGMRMLEIFVKQLKASMEIERVEGTSFKIFF